MPIYPYLCKLCGYEFEETQKITDEKFTTCPKCNQDSLTRLIGGNVVTVWKGGSPTPKHYE